MPRYATTPQRSATSETDALPHLRAAQDRSRQTWDTARGLWLEHRLLLLIAAAYMAVGGVWLAFQGATWHLTWSYPFVWQMWFVLTAFWLLVQYLRSPRRLRRFMTVDRIMGATLVIALVAPFQSTFQSLKRAIPSFSWDEWLSRVDIAMHGRAPWAWWRPTDRMLEHIDALYAAWFLLIIVFVTWVSWTSRRKLRAQALVSAALLWIVAGTLSAWLLASAGPCYYGRVVEGPDPYTELADRIGSMVLVANGAQRRLWAWRLDGTYGATSGISAMPSMHVGMAVLIAVVAWRRWKPAGVICWAYAVVVQIGSVVLAWHYAIDGYLAALLVAFCWAAAGRLVQWDQRNGT